MITLLFACSESPKESHPAQSNPTIIVAEENGMVQIPAGEVMLGPRVIAAVEGWQSPGIESGITPNLGIGEDQRAPGAPPPPGQANGVGHLRPGSGTPSTPPNMPGNRAKPLKGKEERWSSNPGHQMKSKRIKVSSFWMDQTEVTRSAYQVFIDETGYRPPFVEEEWAEDEWNWLTDNSLAEQEVIPFCWSTGMMPKSTAVGSISAYQQKQNGNWLHLVINPWDTATLGA
jgi:hypothetical protein